MVVVQHSHVIGVCSGTVRVERLENAQTGVRFRLKIGSERSVSSPDIAELTSCLKDQVFARRVSQAFTMEAPTISSLRPMLPKFKVKFLATKARRDEDLFD
ncbi:MAG: hypothetical protein WCV71_00850 [Patescibacteria group bacterium]